MAGNLLKGTMILTLGLVLSRILGVLYVIPFYQLIGEEYVVLYQYAYVPYTIMLAIAVSGVPVAVSKFVSKYNAMGDYATGRKLVKSSGLIMLGTGFVGFLVLFFMAQPLAEIVMNQQASGDVDENLPFNVNDVATVIKYVSFAVLVVPAMSLIRGFFQGYQHMTPTAVSQLIEQIVRIAVLLVGAFVVVKLIGGTEKTAVSFAVFAAFIGALASMGVLFWYWKKLRPEFDEMMNYTGTTESTRSLKTIYKEMLIYTVPFALVGVINPLFQFIDMITFVSSMEAIGVAKGTANTLLGMLNFSSHKLVMIPVMLAMGFAMTLIPLITTYYAKQDIAGLTRSLNQTFQILVFLTLPAALGISLLSYEFYTVFYEASETGASILAAYAPVAILFALYPVTTAILQGIDQQKLIILNLMIGILVKMLLNVPFIKLFETNGAILATSVGYLTAITLNFLVIRYFLAYETKMLFRRLVLIVGLTAVMLVLAFFTKELLELFLNPDSKLQSIVIIAGAAGVGAAFYGFVSLKLGLAQKLFGERLTRFTRKLGIS
ncbi:O-antigen/teichoic acid export membrane protein [Chryseomicrobium aureum]|uniref:putative polysaccharide biosynthesis protein n=1 Tax=Chryseomicrobium aureum TaxID=1441723 RepID=UPI00195D2FE9|nr:polysaccharide biosynthesis protein [Chryseomicrobium aureum]MBM7706903.1 O-antigen/teichoic acid export membrane protein [Chryseomicrobium aureum]